MPLREEVKAKVEVEEDMTRRIPSPRGLFSLSLNLNLNLHLQ